ncbi:hypothetical protein HOV00_gp40 [Microbacterium phage Schubert]|uniref:Uncharacterized protein n=1 Tax=Microbacterium phage Schubert TaxID=2500787 RepID=A0A3Q9RAS7_9CAUD|nr:hypothetical protein HOV00_gp40 [Microbacterium phage Schubert]AZV01759.1 hypothetical protein SEA_SCHUBERT_53 [Microbacterium phage Schubert]
MARTVILPISDNQGYSPEQVSTQVTLGGLLEAIQIAIEEFGEDATVVLSNGQQYGAGYGKIATEYTGEVVFSDADDEGDYF